ncbi:UDP-N-acetylmuramoyl-tripeptide--D-alanyl-D-alanine ligase [Kineosphaera limosa]|uniref:UDP-N-acetylmuramoyl-tripeptide--D-alanyl-D-alanine ligase n=1 Tax=Kineosphaera limosa NBRC 100340 TaxID=1184609 RepID=K6VJC2_9MICO|nr:UDP-N-acetylmuramoyl-tripeptide--D-alanyl-D-alanine ligase [Kineosphaera limosa]NYD99265.1 UDP-N-acetylmuramoyl-tripeptide--D-alanyl-D-alanine ligase [Kineosphaera limosa]GAB96303.1 UDP-N-acetylmuramoyl-tripeptide--D-alanyl-D-alanine ligase [Kineosphaera limosa NBRC 100340]
MIPLTLAQLAAITGGTVHPAGGDGAPAAGDPGAVLVDGPVVTDAREAGPGSLYVARIGEHADGHGYVPQAVQTGAAAALVTRPVEALPHVLVPDVQEAFAAIATHVIDTQVQRVGLQVVGITGSSGKTTTKDLLAAVLERHAPTVANVGSLNSEVGVPLTVCRITADTRFLVLEMGARGIGHIRYLTDMTHPRIGVVLNVGSAHVGEFGSREVIAQAKAELVQALPPGGLAVLNADDPLVRAMAVAPDARTVFVGSAGAADVRATDVELMPTGCPQFTLHVGGQRHLVTMGLLGLHQVDNALAVAAVAAEAGMAPADIAQALSAARAASRWRMERVERADGVTILNDAYNANPESMAAALRTLAHLGAARQQTGDRPGRTWAVLGGMLELGPDGPRDHYEMGCLARELGIEEVLAVGALAEPIAAGAAGASAPDVRNTASAGQRDRCEARDSGTNVNTRSRCVSDTDAAFTLLQGELRHGDVVLLKSSRDSGLRLLGDRLASDKSEVGS